MAETDTPEIDLPKAVPLIETPATLPVADQSSSPLMRCPPEIRLQILRELLVTGEPLDERKTYTEKPGWNGKYKDKRGRYTRWYANSYLGYNLTPAVLLGCQGLLQEGWPLLYQENTLVLCVHPSYLSGHVPGEGCSWKKYCDGCVWSSALESSVAAHTHETHTYKLGWELNPFQEQRLSRFQRFIIRNIPQTTTTLNGPVRTLSKILSQKSLEVQNSFSVHTDVQLRCWQLKSFLLLRCRRFSIAAVDGYEDLISEIVQVVESTEEVRDLERLMEPVRDYLRMICYSDQTSSFYEPMSQARYNMEDDVKEHDLDMFLQHRGIFMKHWEEFYAEKSRAFAELDKDVLGDR